MMMESDLIARVHSVLRSSSLFLTCAGSALLLCDRSACCARAVSFNPVARSACQVEERVIDRTIKAQAAAHVVVLLCFGLVCLSFCLSLSCLSVFLSAISVSVFAPVVAVVWFECSVVLKLY